MAGGFGRSSGAPARAASSASAPTSVPSSRLKRRCSSASSTSKREAGKVELEAIDFDLVDTVESAVGLLGPTANDKGIALGVLIEPAARAGFRGDPTRVRQVLLNLVGNAVKFTEQGRVSVEIA